MLILFNAHTKCGKACTVHAFWQWSFPKKKWLMCYPCQYLKNQHRTIEWWYCNNDMFSPCFTALVPCCQLHLHDCPMPPLKMAKRLQVFEKKQLSPPFTPEPNGGLNHPLVTREIEVDKTMKMWLIKQLYSNLFTGVQLKFFRQWPINGLIPSKQQHLHLQ